MQFDADPFQDLFARALQDAQTRAAYEDAEVRSQIVDTLISLRHRLGLTQTQVAEAIGVKQPTVSGFETEGSDPRLSTIQRYARAVNAVLVWDVRPLHEGPNVRLYRELGSEFHTAVNQREPSERAKSWRPRVVYAPSVA